MVIRPKYNWFKMLLVWKGSVLPEILPRLIFIFILSALVIYFHGVFFSVKVSLNPTPFTLMGIALAIFLGFRNSAAYDRFWEGRKLWGALLNVSRSLSRQALTFTGLDANHAESRKFLQLIIAFAYCTKHQLRKTDATADLKRLVPQLANELSQAEYKAAILLRHLGQWVQDQKEAGRLDSITAGMFDKNLNDMSDIVGGCERIANTPIPYPYAVLLHRTVYIYCVLLPFGLMDSIGWMTPAICTFVAYTFMALDAIVNQIEEPFGTEDNDLALNQMCETIEVSVQEMRGEKVPHRKHEAGQFVFN
ncbi:bestrophin family protein [Bdellovibrio bacteriovorus]|uniref:bestrophin family protein n=1 Tax=Bdellovibrio bacteriovorus TaxID=959 RepID=UPI0035A5B984